MAGLIYMDLIPLLAFPLGLVAIYAAIFHTDYVLISLFFFTPLSFNIEKYSESFGLFIPTEPLIFGLLLLTIWKGLLGEVFPKYLRKNLIVISLMSYLLVLLFTSIVSTNPIVSFKFLLVKIWYIVPMLGLGTRIFEQEKNRRLALWLYVIGITIAIIYTVINHAQYSFGEKESHWVMFPFFKDHTSYGAMIAFSLFLLMGLFLSKKYSPLALVIILGLIVINLIGLYLSYTRAAWLSVIFALGVWVLIHFRVKFSYLLTIFVISLTVVLANWNDISYAMSKNKKEHTTEDFGERLQSSTNVTSDASNLERINRWTCAIDMFLDKPITGFGAGTYAFEYAPYQRPENKTIISTNFGTGGNAHSEYLGALAETGIFGLLTFVFFVSMLFYRGIILYYRLDNRDDKILVLSMVLALSTYFLHAFLNNYLDTDKAAIPIFGIAAIFIALEQKIISSK